MVVQDSTTPEVQHRTWTWWIGRLFSSSRGPVFSGSILIVRGVTPLFVYLWFCWNNPTNPTTLNILRLNRLESTSVEVLRRLEWKPYVTHKQRLISAQYTMIHQQCMTFVCLYKMFFFTDSIPWDSSPLNRHLGEYISLFSNHQRSKSKVIAKEIIDGDCFFILQITMGHHSGQEDFWCTSNVI